MQIFAFSYKLSERLQVVNKLVPASRKQGDEGFTEMQNFEKTFQTAEKKRAASKFNEAIKFYLSAQRLCGNNSEAELSCLLALGDCYRMIGAYEEAQHKIKKGKLKNLQSNPNLDLG